MFWIFLAMALGFPVIAIFWELLKFVYSAAIWIIVIGIFVCLAIVSHNGARTTYDNQNTSEFHQN